MQCNRDVEEDALEQKAVSRPGKQGTSELEQGLNFTVNVDFWFCSDDFYKHPEGKKRNFCRFFLSKFKRRYFAKRDDLFAFIQYPILRDILPSDHN